MVSTEGIVKCFSVKAAFDYQGTLCSVLADKRTDRYQNSLFHSEKMRCLKEQKEHGFPHPPTTTCGIVSVCAVEEIGVPVCEKRKVFYNN